MTQSTDKPSGDYLIPWYSKKNFSEEKIDFSKVLKNLLCLLKRAHFKIFLKCITH